MSDSPDYKSLKTRFSIHKPRTCVICDTDISKLRIDAVYCSHACAQRAYLFRKALTQNPTNTPTTEE